MSNYVEMWKDLGMDLEAHDLLCQVLPTAVGDVPQGYGFLGSGDLRGAWHPPR